MAFIGVDHTYGINITSRIVQGSKRHGIKIVHGGRASCSFSQRLLQKSSCFWRIAARILFCSAMASLKALKSGLELEGGVRDVEAAMVVLGPGPGVGSSSNRDHGVLAATCCLARPPPRLVRFPLPLSTPIYLSWHTLSTCPVLVQ